MDNSYITWYVDGVYQSQYDNLTSISASETIVAQEWFVEIIPGDGFGTGTPVRSVLKIIEDRPNIIAFGADPQTDVEGHFIIWANVTSDPFKPAGDIRPTVTFNGLVNDTDPFSLVANWNGSYYIID